MSAFLIISNNELALRNPENIKEFGSSYQKWIGTLLNNVAEISGKAVELDWVPEQ